ncbi:glycosyltransferase [Thermodesulfobacteriota bacterium]
MKTIIVAPFWADKQHLSTRRTSRFVRWLQNVETEIVLVRGGSRDSVISQPWGVEISVRDPLGLRKEPEDPKEEIQKQYNPIVQFISDIVFNPDPGIVWAKRASKHPAVLDHGAGADFVIASSPPPSALVAAAKLSDAVGGRFIVDMRDGWLDEPLKLLLQSSRLQRFREGRLERRILDRADRIFVTSGVWKYLLAERRSETASKITVLTNGYPDDPVLFQKETTKQRGKNEIRLLYTGRLSGSRSTQHPDYLLKPLLEGIKDYESGGEVVIVGALTANDKDVLEKWQEPLHRVGWRLILQPPVPREKVPEVLAGADGLLLLCASQAAIPSKVFEYIPSRKPIFSVSEKGSAIWDLGKDLPQFFQYNLSRLAEKDTKCVRDFLEACQGKDLDYVVPEDYSDEILSGVFLKGTVK